MEEQGPTREEVIKRHKKEIKDLVATVTGLKKQATKKTRKNVMTKCQELEENLQRKHKEELEQFDNDSLEHPDDGQQQEEVEVKPEDLLAQLTVSTQENQQPQQEASPSQAPKKRNRQKERIAKRQAEIDRIKQEAAIEAANTIDYRQIEIDSMNQLLAINNLVLYDIKPDGHCLFASIQDQLCQRHEINKSIQDLRDLAGEYINTHRDDFIPFLFDEQTCEVRDIDDYLHELTTTAMWGSDMEILALGKIFDCPISVYMAGASTLKINAEGTGKELKLGYYKHSYGLGEHYNSLRDAEH